MKRYLFLLLFLSLIFLAPTPDALGKSGEDGPNLQIPDDLSEKAKEALEEGIKAYKKLKDERDNEFKEAYRRPIVRMKERERDQKKVEKMIKTFQKAAKEAPKCHLPPYYLCIMYQWLYGYKDRYDPDLNKAKVQGKKAMGLKDDFYEAALELADICTRLEKHEEALKSYDDALKMSKGELDKDYDFHMGRLDCCVELKNWAEAKKCWEGYQKAKEDVDPKLVDNVKILFK
ncbi:MAG: tetratricopeptide repeat protein, partial [Planctomycetota bacterium]